MYSLILYAHCLYLASVLPFQWFRVFYNNLLTSLLTLGFSLLIILYTAVTFLFRSNNITTLLKHFKVPLLTWHMNSEILKWRSVSFKLSFEIHSHCSSYTSVFSNQTDFIFQDSTSVPLLILVLLPAIFFRIFFSHP